MKSIDKIQDKLFRDYGGIKNGYISEESRQKARKKKKRKKK